MCDSPTSASICALFGFGALCMANCILLPYTEVGVIKVPCTECITNTEILIYEVLKAVITEIVMLWDVMPCSLQHRKLANIPEDHISVSNLIYDNSSNIFMIK